MRMTHPRPNRQLIKSSICQTPRTEIKGQTFLVGSLHSLHLYLYLKGPEDLAECTMQLLSIFPHPPPPNIWNNITPREQKYSIFCRSTPSPPLRNTKAAIAMSPHQELVLQSSAQSCRVLMRDAWVHIPNITPPLIIHLHSYSTQGNPNVLSQLSCSFT